MILHHEGTGHLFNLGGPTVGAGLMLLPTPGGSDGRRRFCSVNFTEFGKFYRIRVYYALFWQFWRSDGLCINVYTHAGAIALNIF